MYTFIFIQHTNAELSALFIHPSIPCRKNKRHRLSALSVLMAAARVSLGVLMALVALSASPRLVVRLVALRARVALVVVLLAVALACRHRSSCRRRLRTLSVAVLSRLVMRAGVAVALVGVGAGGVASMAVARVCAIV